MPQPQPAPDEPVPLSRSGLRQLQAAMDEFVRSRGWYDPQSSKPQQPANLAASIVLEAGEVLECFQWGGPSDHADVGAELADVTLYVAQLANVLDIDLAEAVTEKMRINEDRWPRRAETLGQEKSWPRLAS